MSLYALIRNAFDPDTLEFTLCEDDIEIKGHLDGNLCRCTGYKPILQAAKTFILQDLHLPLRPSERSSPAASGNLTISPDPYKQSSRKSCGRPGGCCRNTPGSSCSSSPSQYGQSSRTSLPSQAGPSAAPQFESIPYTPTTELIYPPGLSKHVDLPLCYGNEQKIWIRPTTLEQLIQIKTACPSASLVNGASEVQVDIRFKNAHHPVSILVGDLKELASISTVSTSGHISELVIGGTASLSDIEAECHRLIPLLQPRASVIQAITKALRYFAGRQIRNAASLAGNMATASPISDMTPLLLAVNATVISRTEQGEHFQSMHSMFLGYRKTALPEGAIITQICIPIPSPDVPEITKSYEQAKRKDDDIAIVTAGFRVRLDDQAMVREVALAYGGMAPTTVLASSAGKSLIGKPWGDTEFLEEALDALLVDFDLPYSVPGCMATYRRTLALSFFVRF